MNYGRGAPLNYVFTRCLLYAIIYHILIIYVVIVRAKKLYICLILQCGIYVHKNNVQKVQKRLATTCIVLPENGKNNL